MSDLNYFRRAIRDAVGSWLADQIAAAPMDEPLRLPAKPARLMAEAREQLLARVDQLEMKGESPE